MARMKDRVFFAVRRRGCNLFLGLTDGETYFGGFSADSFVTDDPHEAEDKLELLPEHDRLEVVPLKVSFLALPASAAAKPAPVTVF